MNGIFYETADERDVQRRQIQDRIVNSQALLHALETFRRDANQTSSGDPDFDVELDKSIQTARAGLMRYKFMLTEQASQRSERTFRQVRVA